MILPADLLDLIREGFLLVTILLAPIIGAVFLAGLLTGLLQMFTRMNEPTLSHVARVVAVTATLVATAPWMFEKLAVFTERVWSYVQIVGS